MASGQPQFLRPVHANASWLGQCVALARQVGIKPPETGYRLYRHIVSHCCHRLPVGQHMGLKRFPGPDDEGGS